MIFVDTGAWFAAVVPSDPNHTRAASWIAANTSPFITTDYVVDETLTLLRARRERERAITIGEKFFNSDLVTIHKLTLDDLRGAWEVFCRFDDKNWSFTDCASKFIIERLGIKEAFAFDHHFTQFGSVRVVP